MLGMHHAVKKKSHWAIETIGWLGAISVLLAYMLAAFSYISADGFWYTFLNLVGAVGIMVIAIHKGVIQSIVLNGIWIIIAIVAIVNLWLK